MDRKLLHSVKEVFDKFKFNIPEYQRGYKWTADNITKMLEDINKFEINDERYYCLQNITIKEKDNIFDVIDGQQRLTTLVILLSYLNKSELIKDKLKYSIRDVSHNFLNDYIIDKQDAHEYYDSSTKKFTYKINEVYNYQDIFHFVQASYTIRKWLKDKDTLEFTDKLLSHVKLIVNNVENSDNQEKIFANLNSNKVALTDVELIRAILITRSMKHQRESSTEDIVSINEHRVKLGWELDQFHIWWSDKSVSKLFSALTNNKNASGIELLYLLFCQSMKSDQNLEEFRDILDKCSEEDITSKYQGIMTFHHTMQDWYQDSKMYHYIGFLGAYNVIKIEALWSLWGNKNQTRTEFIKKLKRNIFNYLVDTKNTKDDKNNPDEKVGELYSNIKNIEYSWYPKEYSSLSAKILVLMDIIQILNQKENKESRRLPVDYFTKLGGQDDLEHIFSQTPNEKTKYENALEELKCIEIMLNNYSDKNDLKTKCEEISSAFQEEKKEIKLSEEHRGEYISFIQNCHFLHSIGNLLLLSKSINRSYGNSEYMEKRNRIVKEAQTGKYVRPHTWTVFTKTFSNKDEDKNLHRWSIDYIRMHAKYIATQLEDHFKDIQNVSK